MILLGRRWCWEDETFVFLLRVFDVVCSIVMFDLFVKFASYMSGFFQRIIYATNLLYFGPLPIAAVIACIVLTFWFLDGILLASPTPCPIIGSLYLCLYLHQMVDPPRHVILGFWPAGGLILFH